MARTIEAEPIEDVDEAQGKSLRNLLHIVYKRKWLVLLTFLCSAAAATSFTVFVISKPSYVASSQILVSPSREQLADATIPTGGTVAPWSGFNAVEQTAWATEILKGHFLAERVVKEIGPSVLYPKRAEGKWTALQTLFGLAPSEKALPEEINEKVQQENAIKTLLKNITVDPAGRSSIINVSFKHGDPELAAKVVNLLGDMYVERHMGVQKNPKTDAFFQEQFIALKKKLNESEEIVAAFKQRFGITTSVKHEQELASQQQLDLRKELTETRGKRAEVQSRDAELRSQLANTSRTPATVDRRHDRLTSLEFQEGELALRLTALNPALISLRTEISKLREHLKEAEAANLYGATGSGSAGGSLYASLQAELLHNDAEGKALRAREETQANKIAELQTRLDKLEGIFTDFNHLEKQALADENNYRLYLTKFEESRISGAMDAEKISAVRVIESAQTPVSPLDSKRNIKIILGILGSAFGAVVLAFLLQFLGRSLDTAEDVERYLDLPVLASIPRLKA